MRCNKQRKPSSFEKLEGFGPGCGTWTHGLLIPKNWRNFFLILSVRFWRFLLRIPCFPNLTVPLLPRVPNLSMVKNVVKTASHNLRQLFSQVWEAVSFRDCSLRWGSSQVLFKPIHNWRTLKNCTAINKEKGIVLVTDFMMEFCSRKVRALWTCCSDNFELFTAGMPDECFAERLWQHEKYDVWRLPWFCYADAVHRRNGKKNQFVDHQI